MNNTDVPTLRQVAKKLGYTRISHSVQKGKETDFPCIFITDPKTGDSKVIMISKGLAKEIEHGDPVKPLWDNPVTTSEDGKMYLGRPQYDDIEEDEAKDA